MLIRDIALFLQANEVGIFDEVGNTSTIFLFKQPSSPDDCITIYDTGGLQPIRNKGLDEIVRTVQVIVRNVDPVAVHQKSWEIYHLLNQNYIEMEEFQVIVSPVNPPYPIGQDESERFEYTLNFRILTETD